MMTRIRNIRPAGFVAGVIAALVIGGGSAYAANGGSVILGKANYATAGTGISNSGGTPLYLYSKSGTPPLKVNRTVKVPYLNSDLLDGLDQSAFLRATGKAVNADKLDGYDNSAFALAAGGHTGYITANGEFADVDSDGVADVLIATATCPVGTKLTGGGVDNWTGHTTLVDSAGPDGTWWAAAIADEYSNVNDDVVAYAVCYNPRGVVPGATTIAPSTSTKTQLTPQDLLRDKVAAHLKK